MFHFTSGFESLTGVHWPEIIIDLQIKFWWLQMGLSYPKNIIYYLMHGIKLDKTYETINLNRD